MESYFSKFPTIAYSNTVCRDITKRVEVVESVRNIPNLFYPLELKAGMRADSLADAYYEDPELDWMLYLSNKVVDPYYQWYLDEREFKDFIVSKYGSIETAIKKIKYYRSNWASDRQELSPTGYNTNLALDLKKYYTPEYGPGSKIIAYHRRQEDWTMNTNKILHYDITYSSGNTFTEGEIVDIYFDVNVVGGGEVVYSNSTALIIQHVSGNTHANSSISKTFIGESSNTSASSVSLRVIQENITNAEAIFWEPVSFFDYENEYNESKKHISVISSAYSLDVAEQFRKTLKE